MAVPEQTPYREYTANGVTKSFALGFDCESQNHLTVRVDDIESVVGTWSLSVGAVVFGTPLPMAKKLPFSEIRQLYVQQISSHSIIHFHQKLLMKIKIVFG